MEIVVAMTGLFQDRFDLDCLNFLIATADFIITSVVI